MNRSSLAALALVAAGAAALWPGPARAQTDTDQEAARQHYEAGAAAFEAGDFATAQAEMEESYRLFPSLRTLYSVALCLHARLDYPRALELFARYLQEGGEQVPDDLRTEATELIEQMRRELVHLAVEVDIDGAEVTVDGVLRGKSPLPAPLELGPGTHAVEVRRDGFLPWTREVPTVAAESPVLEVTLEPVVRPVTVVAGEPQTVSLELVPAAGGSGTPDGGEQPDAEGDDGDSLWWVWTTVGAMAAGGVILGIVLGTAGSEFPHDDYHGSMP
jgi:hypothetical protein